MSNTKTPGQIAYEGYNEACGNKSFRGEPLPTWEQMIADPERKHLAAYWEAAGRNVLLKLPDERIVMQALLKLLNEALVLDPAAVTALFDTKVPCTNEKFVSHPTIVAGAGNTISVVGLLNGLFKGGTRITKTYPSPPDGVPFDRNDPGALLGFIETVPVTIHAATEGEAK